MNKSKNKKGLGRGLKALFGDQKQSDNKNKTSKNSNNVRKANLSDLSRNRYQPRNYFDTLNMVVVGAVRCVYNEVAVRMDACSCLRRARSRRGGRDL